MHALHSKLSLQEYADKAGIKSRQTVAQQIWAAKVMKACKNIFTGDPSDHFISLSIIHAAPEWLWPALVTKMVAEGMTVDATRKMVAGVKDVREMDDATRGPINSGRNFPSVVSSLKSNFGLI